MITVTLEEPDAMATLSLLLLGSARSVEVAEYYVKEGNPEAAKHHSQRGEKLKAVAQALQRAILLQRGITEP